MSDPLVDIAPCESMIRQEGVNVIGEVAVDQIRYRWGQHQSEAE